MAQIVKKATTGLTGLTVARTPHHTLGLLYGKIIRALDKIPNEAAYKKYTEEIINERAKILKENSDVEAVEKKIGCGQIEELIVQAENELLLARKMATWSPWNPLEVKPPANQWSWPPAKPAAN